jgi:ABC-2 type transport system permease protein
MKWWAFTKRNLLETIRDPLSLIFCFLFPVLIFLIFQIVSLSIVGSAQYVPQFQTEALFITVPQFAFTFLMLFVALLVAKDRSTAFLTRLRTTPMKSKDFILGYALATIPLGLGQIIIISLLAICFGLKFTANSLLAMVCEIPSMLMFIGLGLLLGSSLNDKAVGGISSGLITISTFLSGMFMSPEAMVEGFQIAMKILPFYNSNIMASNANYAIYSGNWVWEPIVIVFAYLIVFYAAAILVFSKKMKADA